MKTKMFFLIVITISLLTMTACQKENASQETTDNVNTESMDNNENDMDNNEDERLIQGQLPAV